MPDLDQIKQGKQEAQDRRGQFPKRLECTSGCIASAPSNSQRRAGASTNPPVRRLSAPLAYRRVNIQPPWKVYLSSQTSSMRQPLKRLLTMRVSPFTYG